ncbi:MAG TPA: hypothetical protein VGE51_01225 [Fontimonas sp.]
MSDDIVHERSLLDARSRHYEQEMRRAAQGLRASITLLPQAAGGLRRVAPALPLIAAVGVAGVLLLRLRARRAPPLLMVGGLLFDAWRLWTLRQSPRRALPAPQRAPLPLRPPANAEAVR